jgi:ComF family protein
VPLAELLSPLAPPVCWGCGGPGGRVAPLCRECRASLRWLEPEPVTVGKVCMWAPLAYEGGAQAMVGALKFRGAVRVADTMAAQMVGSAPPGVLEHRSGIPARLVPVPLHPARERKRGFNQAERLAAAISVRTGFAVAACLQRCGSPIPQVGRGRAERLAGIEGAIEVAPGAVVPRRAVLIDDVVTTGATLAACADALRRAGALSVAAVAYARTPGR